MEIADDKSMCSNSQGSPSSDEDEGGADPPGAQPVHAKLEQAGEDFRGRLGHQPADGRGPLLGQGLDAPVGAIPGDNALRARHPDQAGGVALYDERTGLLAQPHRARLVLEAAVEADQTVRPLRGAERQTTPGRRPGARSTPKSAPDDSILVGAVSLSHTGRPPRETRAP